MAPTRSTGILRSWNDERGFGFIAPAQGGAELFVHISAMPRDGSRPAVGETLSFELGRGKDGKVQAVNVIRTAIGDDLKPGRGRRPTRTESRRVGWLGQGLVLCLVIALGAWGFKSYRALAHRQQLADTPATSTTPEPATSDGVAYRCDGRTRCSQMTSCAEATWFINHCPGTQMDGNRDGVPCEQQWCTGPGAR